MTSGPEFVAALEAGDAAARRRLADEIAEAARHREPVVAALLRRLLDSRVLRLALLACVAFGDDGWDALRSVLAHEAEGASTWLDHEMALAEAFDRLGQLPSPPPPAERDDRAFRTACLRARVVAPDALPSAWTSADVARVRAVLIDASRFGDPLVAVQQLVGALPSVPATDASRRVRLALRSAGAPGDEVIVSVLSGASVQSGAELLAVEAAGAAEAHEAVQAMIAELLEACDDDDLAAALRYELALPVVLEPVHARIQDGDLRPLEATIAEDGPNIGDVCIVRTADDAPVEVALAVVVGLDPELGAALLCLASPSPELRTDVDVPLAPEETGLPFPIVIHRQISGAALLGQVGPVVASVPEAAVDDLLRTSAGAALTSYALPLSGHADPRWSGIDALTERSHRLSSNAFDLLVAEPADDAGVAELASPPPLAQVQVEAVAGGDFALAAADGRPWQGSVLVPVGAGSTRLDVSTLVGDAGDITLRIGWVGGVRARWEGQLLEEFDDVRRLAWPPDVPLTIDTLGELLMANIEPE